MSPDHGLRVDNAKVDLNDFEGAINDYNKVLELDPEGTIAYLHRGIAKTHLKRSREAEEDYNKVLQLNPADAAACYRRGNVRALQTWFDRAPRKAWQRCERRAR